MTRNNRFLTGIALEAFSLTWLLIPTRRVITRPQISMETVFPVISFGENLPDYSRTFTVQ
jgi:hypothetical protein